MSRIERKSDDQSLITASATPRAVVTLTGILGLRRGHPNPCTIDEDGVAVWRLNCGIVVTCRIEDDRAHWHVDHDEDR